MQACTQKDGSWDTQHAEPPPTARKLEASGPVKAEVVPSAHSAVATALPLFIIYADSLETDEILHACVKKEKGCGEEGRGQIGQKCNEETDETNDRV